MFINQYIKYMQSFHNSIRVRYNCTLTRKGYLTYKAPLIKMHCNMYCILISFYMILIYGNIITWSRNGKPAIFWKSICHAELFAQNNFQGHQRFNECTVRATELFNSVWTLALMEIDSSINIGDSLYFSICYHANIYDWCIHWFDIS